MIVRPIVCRSFIGRQVELEYLHQRRRDAGSSRGGLVLVSGEAGVGNTRLSSELRATLAKSRVRVAVGQCLDFAQRPYGPLLDLVARFEPGAVIESAASKREQFEWFERAFERAEAKNPLVAIVEDLHSADLATLEFLTFFCAKLPSMRMLVVASYRGDEVPADHPTFAAIAKIARATPVARIHSTLLAGPELGAFIDEALRGVELARDVRDVRTGEGNPFFTEELLRNAVERGPGAAGDGRRLPATVRAAVLERLRPLSADDRRVLAQAAVVGRSFDIELLCATLDMPHASFRFRHALTCDAIYDDYLASQVRPLDRRIVEVLEALLEERRSIESLAYHAWAAGDGARSARYNELAGDAAGRLNAHSDALAAYERAFESNTSPSHERARLLEKIARRQVNTGCNDAALRTFARAADTLQLLADSGAEAALRVRAAIQAYRLGEPKPVLPLHAMLERCAAADGLARTRLHLGIAHIAGLQYRPSAAAHHLDLAESAAIAGDADLRYSYRAARALVTYILGDADGFEAEIDTWLAAAYEASDPASIALVHYNGGMYLSNLGRHEPAEAHFTRAFAVARAQRDRMGESAAYAMHARALLARGDLAGVRRCVDAVHALRTDSEIATAHAAAWGTLAGLYLDDAGLVERWFDALHGRIAAALAFMYAPGYATVLVRRGRPRATAMLRASCSPRSGPSVRCGGSRERPTGAAGRRPSPLLRAKARARCFPRANARSPSSWPGPFESRDRAGTRHQSQDDGKARRFRVRETGLSSRVQLATYVSAGG